MITNEDGSKKADLPENGWAWIMCWSLRAWEARLWHSSKITRLEKENVLSINYLKSLKMLSRLHQECFFVVLVVIVAKAGIAFVVFGKWETAYAIIHLRRFLCRIVLFKPNTNTGNENQMLKVNWILRLMCGYIRQFRNKPNIRCLNYFLFISLNFHWVYVLSRSVFIKTEHWL